MAMLRTSGQTGILHHERHRDRHWLCVCIRHRAEPLKKLKHTLLFLSQVEEPFL